MTVAGFYHASVKNVGRANGRSIVAAAAYRAGERLEDERTGEIPDFRARGGVLDTFIIAPDAAPDWARNRARLWNEAERAETRANGRLATELELALPHELSPAARKQLLRDFLAPVIERYGVAADVAIHEPGEGKDHRNVHAHVLLTHRELGAEGFGEIANTRTITRKRKGREVQEQVAGIAATPADIKAIRLNWEQHVNRAYERAGLDIRVDHRSHKERGIEQEPTKHLGPAASAMENRGEASDRGDENREIEARNAERARLAELAAEAAALKIEEARQAAARDAERAAYADAQGRKDDTRGPHYDREAAETAWQKAIVDGAIEAERAAYADARGRKDDTRGPQEARQRREASAEAGPQKEAAQAPPLATETGRGPWMMQTGGVAGLSEEQCASALQSYARWAEAKPDAARRFGFAQYVDYVQAKWAENRHQAEAIGGGHELHQAARVAETLVHATFEAAASEAVTPALSLAGHAARIFSAVYDFVFGWAMAEPQQTAQQVHQEAQAAGNVETQHARATQAERADYNARLDELLRQTARDDAERLRQRRERGDSDEVDRGREREY